MHDRLIRARWLALSAHTGSWATTALALRLQRVLPANVDARKLAARLHVCFGAGSAPSPDTLRDFMLREPLLAAALEQGAIAAPALDPPVMSSQPSSLITLPLPVLETLRDVGRWLGLQAPELDWFCDRRSRQSSVSEPALHHYRYAWMPKRSGGLRLIEAPKPRLKAIQRQIVREILNRVPPHDNAHAYCRGRSIRSFTAPHLSQDVVLKFDLQDFFASVPTPRIAALFRTLGYPHNVAWTLQGLCTHSVAPALAGADFAELTWEQRRRLIDRHLPQGAPTSAALANLCLWRLDCRLSGLATRYGLQYTRYADDLAFSGPAELAAMARFIETGVAAIVLDEGFSLNHHKTRLRTRAQRQLLAGVVVNENHNLRREDWDRLKATLHNCVRYGPDGQNIDGHHDFRAHLQGRVAHLQWLNPPRGAKLRALLEQIRWPPESAGGETGQAR